MITLKVGDMIFKRHGNLRDRAKKILTENSISPTENGIFPTSNGFVFSKLQLVCYRRGRTSNLRNDKQRSLCPAWHIADGRLLLQVSLCLCLYCLCVCVSIVYHGHSVPQDHLSWISLHPAAAPLSLGPQRHHGKCNKQFWGTEILWLASIFAHLSLPWSIGWGALAFLVCSFVCLFVRPAMVTPD